MYKYIIFDLDGTLLNTSDGIIKSINNTIKKLSLPDISFETKKTFIGPPISESLKRIYNISDEKAKLGHSIFREIYENNYLYDASIYDGIIELLEFLNEKKIYMAIATYKKEEHAKKIITRFGLNKYFKIINGSNTENSLTKVNIIQNCFIYSHINNNEILMIGDTESDYKAAMKLDINFVGVTYGFGFQENKNNIKLVNSAKEIIKFLKN